MSYDGVVRAATPPPTRYWATRETSGVTLSDDMGGGDLAITGSPVLGQVGLGGSIAQWDDDGVARADSAPFTLASAFVVTAMIEVYSDSTGFASIFSYGTSDTDADTNAFELAISGSHQLSMTIAGYGTMPGSTVLSVGRHHVAAYVGYNSTGVSGDEQIVIRIDGSIWDAFQNFVFAGASGGKAIVRAGQFGSLTGKYGIGKVAFWNGLEAATPFGDDQHAEAVAGGGDAAPPPPGAASATGAITLSANAMSSATPWPTSIPLLPGHNQATRPTTTETVRPYGRVWYVYTPSEDNDGLAIDTFATQSSGFADTLLNVYTGPDLTNAVLQASDDDVSGRDDGLSQVTMDFLAGTTYHIEVGTYSIGGDGITQYDLNAPYSGYNADAPGHGTPAPPDPTAAFYRTEIESTLAPASGHLAVTSTWMQTAPAGPTLELHQSGSKVWFLNPAVLDDTIFTVRYAITDNLGGVLTEDHEIPVSAHPYWQLDGGDVTGIQTVRSLTLDTFKSVAYTRSGVTVPLHLVDVSDDLGWAATFTLGARSVLLRRPVPVILDGLNSLTGATLRLDKRMRMLPDPFDGTVDEVWLNDALTTDDPDLGDLITMVMPGAADQVVNGIPLWGHVDYDATAGLGDYLGITLDGVPPDLAKTGKISPAGFVRLLYGPAGLGMTYADIPTDPQLMARDTAPGVSVVDYVGAVPANNGLLQFGDIVAFDAGKGFLTTREGHLPHVGIYLGKDSRSEHRFFSVRPTVGASAADVTSGSIHSTLTPGVLIFFNLPKVWGDLWRSARRY